MGILKSIRNRVGEIKNRLTHVGKTEPLSRVSLVFIILLDIFVFATIQSGIHDQVNQLNSPQEYIPPVCRSIVIDDRWVDDNYIEKIAAYSLNKTYSRTYPKTATAKHPICQSVMDRLAKTRTNKELAVLFKERQKLTQKYKSYDLYQKQSFPEAKQIQLTIRELDRKIVEFDEIKSMRSIITASQVKADQLAEDDRHARFVYPLEKFGMQIMFLLPLFLIFYMWNAVSIKRDRPIQSFLSAHMLVVAFIPIMFRMGELLLDIIPRRFLAAFMELLKSLNLIGLWSYIVIAGAIVGTLLIIYLIQKKLFTKEKLIIKRITKGECIDCSLKLPLGASHCPYCGCNQKVECGDCKAMVAKGAPFCSSCGKSTSE